ncbi:hypothetical protein MHOL44478_12015 [Mycobacterium holsaticum DSM 44478]|nr:hypothetical protein [Mycolicibacterium holsaticum DSM 44478 = JCM 12374]
MAPPSTARTSAALLSASPPTNSDSSARANPNAAGSNVSRSTVPACTRQMVLVVVVVSSSRPSSPCTTSTLAPLVANTPAITSARSPQAQPIRPARGEAGLVNGPSRLNTVGTPISRRTTPACRYDGWNCGANANPMPTSATLRATSSGPRSMRTPSASSVSAPPDSDDAARLPCLITGTPAAATTIEAMVERLTVLAPSPPVPTTSTVSVPITSVGTRRACLSMVSASSVTSADVGRFIRIDTPKPAICAGVAAPVMIWSIAQPA